MLDVSDNGSLIVLLNLLYVTCCLIYNYPSRNKSMLCHEVNNTIACILFYLAELRSHHILVCCYTL